MAWTCCGMKVIPVSCKQPLRCVDWWIFIHLVNKNRRQEVLYTRLLLVDNARRSKCFLTMVKMWIKEIRFYFSVFGYQVKNLKGNMNLSWSKLPYNKPVIVWYTAPDPTPSFSSLDIGVSWVELLAFFLRKLIFNSSTIVAFWDISCKVLFQNWFVREAFTFGLTFERISRIQIKKGVR